MSVREHTSLVALRGGLIGLVACGLTTMIYLAGSHGVPAWQSARAAALVMPAGLGGGVLLAWLLRLRRPWAVGAAGLVLSIAGVITAFVVIYNMLHMSEPMRQHPAWPFGVLMVVTAGAYAWAAVLAD